jgi:hypothetical protein
MSENHRSIHYTTLRSKNISTKGPRNRRSLGFARDDKGKGNGSIEGGCRTEAV